MEVYLVRRGEHPTSGFGGAVPWNLTPLGEVNIRAGLPTGMGMEVLAARELVFAAREGQGCIAAREGQGVHRRPRGSGRASPPANSTRFPAASRRS